MEHSQNAVIVKINAGSVARHNDLVRFTFKPHDHFPNWQEGISKLMVSDFTRPQPMDISFNPYRVLKSFIKQFYEVGIKEKSDSLLKIP